MTRSNPGSATDEFRDVARDALKLGGRCVGAARDWFDEKRDEFQQGRAAASSTASSTRAHGAAAAASAGVAAHGYRGIGPRGYRRDDARVHEDVCDVLTDSDTVDAGNITVSVQDGVVKLAGTVPHRMMKRMAEDLAEGCSGVRDVENALRVGPPPHMGGATSGTASSTGTAGSASAGASGTYGADPSPAGGTRTTGSSSAASATQGPSSGPGANL